MARVFIGGFVSVIALVALFTWAFAAPALAQTGPRDPSPSRKAEPAKSRPAPIPPARQLDELFASLAAAPDAETAGGLTRRIERLWARSGSDTADLLMQRAITALNRGERELAIELLDRVVLLEPDWAEGWSRRATLFFALGDYTRAMADIRQTLAREPRHFPAIAGMGAILEQFGEKKGAYEAYRRAVAINPHLEAPRKAIERLQPDVDGRPI